MAQKTLKKLALIVAASALCAGLSSCQKDPDEKGGFITGGDGTITFGVAFGTPSQDLTVKGSFELKDDEGNVALTMEEATFDTPSPEQTKATLVTGLEDFGTSFQVSGFTLKNGTELEPYCDITNSQVQQTKNTFPCGEGIWIWSFAGIRKFWPVNQTPEFFACAPDNGILAEETTSLTHNKVILTDYEVADPLAQQDLMFAHYYGPGDDNSLGTSGPVSSVATLDFTHALSSIEFKADEGVTGFKINSITLEGIAKTATCTATFTKTSGEGQPHAETADYNWSTPSVTTNYTMTFDPAIDPSELETSLETFIVIPQTFTDKGDQTARIVLNITCGGVDYNISYKLADATRTTAWEAGKTTVYIIKYGDVGVSINDKIISNVKQELEITNTGGVKEYIRVTIVANWCDDEGMIVAPWTDATPTGFADFPGEGWTAGTDGYYYYAHPVAPGECPADPLFGTYTPPVAPVEGSHLEMSIVTQAVVWDEGMENAKAAWGPKVADNLETK